MSLPLAYRSDEHQITVPGEAAVSKFVYFVLVNLPALGTGNGPRLFFRISFIQSATKKGPAVPAKP